MCKFPKIVPVYFCDDLGETEFKFVVPCGKCYDCMRELANQFVLRCNSEYMHSQSTFFCTLTYDDKNIRYYLPDRVKRRKALDAIDKVGIKYFGMYDEFVLDKDDAVTFRKNLQNCIKRYNVDMVFRFVINGEYGTFTHRPHLHALVFSPIYFNKFDFEKLIKECWKFGNVTVSEVTPSRINYCAKHTMKQDSGSSLQQSVAPIFQKRSTYQGGIGRDLVNDVSILLNYHRDINFFQTGKYKISIPRYIRKKLHPEKLTRHELSKLENDSFENLVSRINSDIAFANLDSFKMNNDSTLHDQMVLAVQLVRSVNYGDVKNTLREFYHNKFHDHINRLRNKESLIL